MSDRFAGWGNERLKQYINSLEDKHRKSLQENKAIDCDIFIDREYEDCYGWSPVVGVAAQDPKKILTKVSYNIVIKETSDFKVYEIFENSFKAKLLIEIPEKKTEVSESRLQEIVKEFNTEKFSKSQIMFLKDKLFRNDV